MCMPPLRIKYEVVPKTSGGKIFYHVAQIRFCDGHYFTRHTVDIFENKDEAKAFAEYLNGEDA